MAPISEKQAKTYGLMTVISAWLAVFCLFGYRSSFSIMQKMIIADTGWTTIQVSLGYCLMMTVYAITAFFSGSLVDKKGCRPTYAIGAVCCFLGFFLTSLVNVATPAGFYIYLFTYGLFAGVGTGMLWVSSTVSCRKWYVGARYGTMWGLAFMGAPMAQLLLTLVLKSVLVSMGWRAGMKILSVIMAVFLIVASVIAKQTPDKYGVEAFGLESVKDKGPAPARKKVWTVGEAFKTYAIWATILCFLTAMAGEFLVWSQVVSFFQTDMGMNLDQASNIYLIIGIAGIFAMPLTGKLSDNLVKSFGNERKARKLMLVVGPACGAAGVALLLTKNLTMCLISMVLLAIYWGIEPGGCAGYAGSIFGGATLGRIWGLATLVVMGIGPSFGTFMGAWFKDHFGSYIPALIFCLVAYLISMFLAFTMPLKIKGEEVSDEGKTIA
ncbi:MFS transporter [Clostridium sp. KNHs216]|uniref:MFS transporter n=1 Tax=Clostridium sp. KNHs216 TaxID=1550235 RepID=UPI0011515258|nr:MFS transporter [Clostridium sp. KNHs216]TQI67858.1 sugar phosphate permease [Clostridium sp. KNHs216]